MKISKLLPSNEVALIAEDNEVTIAADTAANSTRILMITSNAIKVLKEG